MFIANHQLHHEEMLICFTVTLKHPAKFMFRQALEKHTKQLIIGEIMQM